MLGVPKPEGSICGARMPSGEAQEPLKQNTPSFYGDPEFHPQPGGVTNPQQQEIGDHDSQVAPGKRGGAARDLGNPRTPATS